MTGTLTGGLRDRMLLESCIQAITTELTARGWFDAGRQHEPILVVDEYPDEDTEVALNTLAISYGDAYRRQLEMGSKAEEHYVPIFCDFFAQSDGLGRHVTGDIYAFIAENPSMPVYDYDRATPVVDFYAVMEENSLEKRRPTRAVNPWQKHWYIVEFRVMDMRANA